MITEFEFPTPKGGGRIDAQLVLPDKALFEGLIDAVITKAESGAITMLPGHLPVLLNLTNAPLIIQTDQGDERVFIVEVGMLEMADNKLTVLLDEGKYVPTRAEANEFCGTAF